MIKCIMCGINKAEKRIWSPNVGEDGFWDVCWDCEKFITQAQHKMIEELIKDHKKKNAVCTKDDEVKV